MKEIGFDNNQFPIQVLPADKIPSNKIEIGSANMLLNQLPGLVGAQQLSNAYKVVFPSGVAGKLMQIKNGGNAGLFTTSIMNGGKIAGQAGLQSLSNLASPLAVFSVVSMVTGQYFMAQINKSINALSENIEEVQKQIDTSEESTVFSASIFLQEIKNDWNLILESEELKNSIITNIIKTVNDLTSSCYYFENRLNSKMTELKNSLEKSKLAEDDLISEIDRNKSFLKFAYEIRACLKTILIFLTSSITNNNAEEIKESLKKDEEILFHSTVKQLDCKIDNIIDLIKRAPNTKLQNQALTIKPIITGIRDITRDRYSDFVKQNIDTTINRIEEIDKKGKNFYIENGKLYVEEIA